MSLDVHLTETVLTNVYWTNITHNLGEMAKEAGIYEILWRPEEVIHSPVIYASHLIIPLTKGLELLKSEPERFTAFNAQNGWGTYNDFVPFVQEYLNACLEHPNAEVEVSR